jgi:hypothetical protein
LYTPEFEIACSSRARFKFCPREGTGEGTHSINPTGAEFLAQWKNINENNGILIYSRIIISD